MNIRQATYADVHHVAINMRPEDAREVYAGRYDADPAAVAYDVAANPYSVVAVFNTEPVAVITAAPRSPVLWEVGMFGTRQVNRIILSMTRYVRRVMIPTLVGLGARRAECRSIEGHTQAHRWLECLGAVREAELPECGKNGETFYLFAWRRSDVLEQSETSKAE